MGRCMCTSLIVHHDGNVKHFKNYLTVGSRVRYRNPRSQPNLYTCSSSVGSLRYSQ